MFLFANQLELHFDVNLCRCTFIPSWTREKWKKFLHSSLLILKFAFRSYWLLFWICHNTHSTLLFFLYTNIKCLPHQFQQGIRHFLSEIADSSDRVRLDQFAVATTIKSKHKTKTRWENRMENLTSIQKHDTNGFICLLLSFKTFLCFINVF